MSRSLSGLRWRQRGIAKSRLLLVIAVLTLAAFVSWGLREAHILASVGSANKGKLLCSAVFVSGRAPGAVLDAELGGGALDQVSVSIDPQSGRTTTALFWVRSDSLHRPGLGCTRIVGTDAEALRQQIDVDRLPSAPDLDAQPWPTGDQLPDELPSGVDHAALEALLDAAFISAGESATGTRALGIVWQGQLIAERYAPGFDRHMPLTGWSMTKSLTSALIGLRMGDGVLDLHEPAPVPEWQGRDDPRRHITLDQLLRASSGLEFAEVYGSLKSDAVQMLFGPHGGDMGGFAAGKPLIAEPDTLWNYSSGTTNLLQRILRDSFDSLEAYHAYVRERLLYPIGMTRTTIAPDASGTLVGSSFGYATARDWLRFGLLFLNDGVWEDERLLPEDWVAYSVTPTLADPLGRYGAQWWLNAGPSDRPEARPWPRLPRETYRASGFEGQYLTVVPSHDLVVIRLGYTPDRSRWAMDDFVADVMAVLDAGSAGAGTN
ncbi:MAG: serine hydrolase [Gammaproteobacteria bacterium]|nr:serine hydrolase [Gammaproteobacteria bacterium]